VRVGFCMCRDGNGGHAAIIAVYSYTSLMPNISSANLAFVIMLSLFRAN
jgi:hypothetical protein